MALAKYAEEIQEKIDERMNVNYYSDYYSTNRSSQTHNGANWLSEKDDTRKTYANENVLWPK